KSYSALAPAWMVLLLNPKFSGLQLSIRVIPGRRLVSRVATEVCPPKVGRRTLLFYLPWELGRSRPTLTPAHMGSLKLSRRWRRRFRSHRRWPPSNHLMRDGYQIPRAHLLRSIR